MLLTGVGFLVATASARPAESSSAVKTPFRIGGTLRVNLPAQDIDEIDPSLAYGTPTWHIEYSTALKLLNYPDAPGQGSRLVPEGASSYKVSRDGRTYTFTIRKGFRFSDGEPVTARNYAYAINRAADRDLQSPAFQFVGDPSAVDIVGIQEVRNRFARSASGVRVHGDKLIIQLVKPDATFLSIITMP